MQSLEKAISLLSQNSVSALINQRMAEFEKMQNAPSNEWFCELCFCLLTANSSAQMGIKMQNALGFEGFYSLPQKKLSASLKRLGYRFYNRRAEFICLARKHLGIKDKVKSFESEKEARQWLSQSIKGLGLKESSHFLRNVGYKNLAILDRHVLSVLEENSVIEKPKTLSAQKYLEIEKKLESLCKKTGTTQGELDLYLWYMKTGKVLK